jgi:hypothetical protein
VRKRVRRIQKDAGASPPCASQGTPHQVILIPFPCVFDLF